MLPDVLQIGEIPKCIITGTYNNRNGMLVATDRRLVFIDKQLFGAMETETILYQALSSVEWSTGVMAGSITLHAHGKSNKVTNVDKGYVRYFANYLETHLMGGDTEAVLRAARNDKPQPRPKPPQPSQPKSNEPSTGRKILAVLLLASILLLIGVCTVECVL